MWFSSSDFCESMCFTRHIEVVSWAKTCKQTACHFLEIPCKMASRVALTVQTVFRGIRGKEDFAVTPSLRLGGGSKLCLWLFSCPSGSHPNVLSMPPFPLLGGNDCVKHLGSANEKPHCWVDSLGLAIPTVVIHKPGSRSWEEFTAALKDVKFLALAPHSALSPTHGRENKLSYSLPWFPAWLFRVNH